MTEHNTGVAEMPRITTSEYVSEHQYATDAVDAHPIDEDIVHDVCESKLMPITIQYDLAALQAVADQRRQIFPRNDRDTLIEQDGGLLYVQAMSATFYELLSHAQDWYESQYTQVEKIEMIVEAHTRQYLRDLHGYEGDFGGETPRSMNNTDVPYNEHDNTLCNAQNDAMWLRDEEPTDAHYTFVDARGLVIECGTHTEAP